MKTEVEYRTFEELLDSVKIDIRGFDLEGMIDDQQLIKVAQRVNYELGLRINPDKSKVIRVEKGMAKLPSDFKVLNFALACDRLDNYLEYPVQWSYKTYDQGVHDGKMDAEMIFKNTMVQQYSTLTEIAPGPNTINHCLGTRYIVVQVFSPDNTMLTFDVNIVDQDNIEIISELTETLQNIKVVVMGTRSSCPNPSLCQVQEECKNEIPKDSCGIEVDTEKCGVVAGWRNGVRYEYKNLSRLRIIKNKSVSPHCINLNSMHPMAAWIKNGFIETNFEEGDLFISYDSLMEDDEGNLLVMDHPLVNEFYEYALKERIYENLFQAGEATQNHLQLSAQKLRFARNNALSFINTPDFDELLQNWRMNRKAMYHNYYNMFKS